MFETRRLVSYLKNPGEAGDQRGANEDDDSNYNQQFDDCKCSGRFKNRFHGRRVEFEWRMKYPQILAVAEVGVPTHRRQNKATRW